MFTSSANLFASLATMAFPSIEVSPPGVPPKDLRRARRRPGQGPRALMEDTPEDQTLKTLEPLALTDPDWNGATITPGPNSGPAIQVSSSQARAMTEDILARLNLI